MRTPGGQRLDVSVAKPGGVADSAMHTNFCRGAAACTLETIFDQSPQGNHLGIEQGMAFLGPPAHDPRAAIDRGVVFNDSRSEARLGGEKVYAAYFEGPEAAPSRTGWVGQGYSNRTATGTAVGEEPQTVYAVLSGRTFNGGCCFDCERCADSRYCFLFPQYSVLIVRRCQSCRRQWREDRPTHQSRLGQWFDGSHLFWLW